MSAHDPDQHATVAREDARRGVLAPGPPSYADLTPERDSLAPGSGALLNKRYRLETRLGQGGMGTVWRSRDEVLDIEVAIKVMRPGLAGGDSGERMLREARCTARLVHPSIVRIFDFGRTDDEDPFIVMELLQGVLLGGLMDRRQGMSPMESIAVLLPVASALRVAHHQGIVHRDLKPENILLSETDLGKVVPKVLDFGIAKSNELGMSRLTQTNAVLGTPDYMSPEQARGRGDVDERTDIWALTVMLYECMCPRRPFQEANYNAQMRAILGDEPLPIMTYGVGDEELWAILARGLAKCAEERWQTVYALGQALALWAHARGLEHDVTGASLAAHWLALAATPRSPELETEPDFSRQEASTAATLAAAVPSFEPSPTTPPVDARELSDSEGDVLVASSSAPIGLLPLVRWPRAVAALGLGLTVLVALATWWRSEPPQPTLAAGNSTSSATEFAVPPPPPLAEAIPPLAEAFVEAPPEVSAQPSVAPPAPTNSAAEPRARVTVRPPENGFPPAIPNF